MATLPATTWRNSLDELCTLAGRDSRKQFNPAWFAVHSAWQQFPASWDVRTGGMQAGMTVDEAMLAEAAQLAKLAGHVQELFQQLEAVRAQLRELQHQRDAVRAFFGTDAPLVVVDPKADASDEAALRGQVARQGRPG